MCMCAPYSDVIFILDMISNLIFVGKRRKCLFVRREIWKIQFAGAEIETKKILFAIHQKRIFLRLRNYHTNSNMLNLDEFGKLL